jgi:hypothetical protein
VSLEIGRKLDILSRAAARYVVATILYLADGIHAAI